MTRRQLSLLGLFLLLTSLANPGTAWAAKRAFIVAVGEYESSKNFPNLPFAVSSCDELETLLKKIGYSDITYLKSDEGVPPSKDVILRAYDRFVSSIRGVDDVFVVFSGHGWGDGKEDFFCPKDAILEREDTLIHVQADISTKLSTKGRRRILIIDACRGDTKTLPTLDDVESVTRPKGRVPTGTLEFYSCQPGQVGYYFGDEKATLFMRSIIRGLEGAADDRRFRDSVGRISLTEWVSYVRAETPRLAMKHLNVEQHPEVDSKIFQGEKWFLNQSPSLHVITAVDYTSFRDNDTSTFFKKAEFNRASFQRLPRSFGRATVRDVNFYKCRFIECDLRNVKFEDCKFVGAEFLNCDLSGAYFADSCYGVAHARVYTDCNTTNTRWPDPKPQFPRRK